MNEPMAALELRPDLTFEDWRLIVQAIKPRLTTIQFYIGDLLNYGFEHFGEDEVIQALGELGYNYAPHTLKNWRSVAKKFPKEARRESLKLDWSHYQVVSGLDLAAANEVLDQAEANDWNTETTKDAARERNGRRETSRLLHRDSEGLDGCGLPFDDLRVKIGQALRGLLECLCDGEVTESDCRIAAGPAYKLLGEWLR